jgi:peptide/nickel transport system substrate-binding protein
MAMKKRLGMGSGSRAAGVLGVVAAAGLALSACGSSVVSNNGGSSGGSSSGSGNTVLTLDGGNYGSITRNFNPFLPTSAAAQLAFTTMIYEPLVQYDGANASVSYPWLAKSTAWSNDNKMLTIHLRSGVKWSDGKPFTSADVVFTFDLLKKDSAINTNGISFSSVTAKGPDTVVMTFAQPSYAEYYYILGLTYMVPKHIWSSVDPTTYADADPVGTGPYTLSSFNSQGVTLTKNPDYWQKGKPAIDKLSFPVYDSNDSAAVALENGTVQWGGQFIPGVQKAFASKSSDNHVWQPGGSDNSLLTNLTTYPLNSLPLRKAISMTLNRPKISELGENGQEAPVTSMTGLVLPAEKGFLAPQYANDTFSVDPTKAMSILTAAGFKRSGSGPLMSPKGTPVKLTLIDPSAYTDFMADAQVISDELKAIGIQVTVQGISANEWQTDLDQGHYQLSIDYANGGPTPYYLYDSILDSKLSAPVGKNASGDYERWNNTATQAALKQFTTAGSDAARQKALAKIEGVMVNDLPVIPLFYSANWGQYSSKSFVGWPGPSNPYELATPSFPTEEVVVLRLQPTRGS